MIKAHRSTDGQFYFTICARNGQVLATSETYLTKKSMKKGILSMMKANTRALEVKKLLLLETQIEKL